MYKPGVIKILEVFEKVAIFLRIKLFVRVPSTLRVELFGRGYVEYLEAEQRGPENVLHYRMKFHFHAA